jgi:hypothetical protein
LAEVVTEVDWIISGHMPPEQRNQRAIQVWQTTLLLMSASGI